MWRSITCIGLNRGSGNSQITELLMCVCISKLFTVSENVILAAVCFSVPEIIQLLWRL